MPKTKTFIKLQTKLVLLLIVVSILLAFKFTDKTIAIVNEDMFLGKEKQTAKVSVLGVFHFGGSADDLASMHLANPFGEKRQAEIAELNDKIAKYKPTKVLVEYPAIKQEKLTAKYQDYRAGKDSLSVNETYQVGFRLAEMSNHDDIFAIDYKLNLPAELLVEYCQRHNRMEEFQEFIAHIHAFVAKENTMLDTMTIANYLLRMNTDKYDRFANDTYIGKTLNWGDSINEAGAKFAATWWERNFIMLRNIGSHIETKDDRLLVIVGSSHRAVIKDLIVDRQDMEYVEIANYLD